MRLSQPIRALTALAAAALLAGCATQASSPPQAWTRVDTPAFSIALPADFRADALEARAGRAGQWSSRRGIIGYDILNAADAASSLDGVLSRQTPIGGRPAVIVTHHQLGGNVAVEAVVSLPGAQAGGNPGQSLNLLLWGPGPGLDQEFLQVIRSIQFKPTRQGTGSPPARRANERTPL